jgi:hypothetical protein
MLRNGDLRRLSGLEIGDTAPGPGMAEGTRISGIVAVHLAEQARRLAKAAKAGRVTNATASRECLPDAVCELLLELMEELQKVRPLERIACAQQEAAGIIDPPMPIHYPARSRSVTA